MQEQNEKRTGEANGSVKEMMKKQKIQFRVQIN